MARDRIEREITRDIPNVSEESLRNSRFVIVYVGAEVKPGDILVGVTPKSETSSI